MQTPARAKQAFRLRSGEEKGGTGHPGREPQNQVQRRPLPSPEGALCEPASDLCPWSSKHKSSRGAGEPGFENKRKLTEV